VSLYELAQLNIATMKEPLESPVMADFVANLDRINALAETSPGFVWRLQTEEGDATALRPMGENVLVNMSVWRDVASLNNFRLQDRSCRDHAPSPRVVRAHVQAYVVLWWVRQGHRPAIAEAGAKLELLSQHGPTAEAFTFQKAFPAPDALQDRTPFGFGEECPAT
jgi:Domain of unknown function (DUF3291)